MCLFVKSKIFFSYNRKQSEQSVLHNFQVIIMFDKMWKEA